MNIMPADQAQRQNLMSCTTEIVSAHLSNNQIATEDIPVLIQRVYKTLASINGDGGPVASERPQPAVPIKRAVTPEYIICLEDGKRLKMLKRHLKTAYGMSPEEYRERWGLSADYPMVAPSYARQRSKLAHDIGLGRRGRKRK